MPVTGTKLRPPPLRRRLVERARLADQLGRREAQIARLILVAAPAGFGKTTFLVQWLAAERSDRAVVWLALDGDEAEPARFVADLVAAVQVALPDVGNDALSLLQASGAVTELVLVSLINDLDALAGPTVVAFDDYHVVDDAAVHDALRFLLDNLPPHVTVAMTTRADPPFPLLGCGRAASWWRSGRPTCGSRETRRASSSTT
jgi:LuxR family maltose regulon positive regulatory protein